MVQTFSYHIRTMEERQFFIPDFQAGLDWFNTTSLSFQHDLKGKLVVLDFWTYCCINCMHVLPELAELEHKYAGKPVVFIGVHSPKFDNEKSSENVRQAILRYEIVHPVVNDPKMSMWRSLGVSSWPTLVVVGPTGKILLSMSGEGNKASLDAFLQEALSFYLPELLDNSILPLKLEKKKIVTESPLSFPGKLAVDALGGKLYISDSNHHRIVVTNLEGKTIEIIGKGEPGLSDGNYSSAAFFRPQGLVYHENSLYVADTENHALRKVDLVKKEVITLAGNGEQGRDYRGGERGKLQKLSTPWDLVIDQAGELLYIAMAGTHQIWKHEIASGKTFAWSGSGAEMNLNGDTLEDTAWAQPSGLTLSPEELFIADSESSSIRAINLKTHNARTLVGGDATQPRNLFAFGDKDGAQDQARLQHPLGVIWVPSLKSVIVADTYNHRLKRLDPDNEEITQWVGSGKAGYRDGLSFQTQFSEPSGFALSPDETLLYVADTNNHLVRIIDLKTLNSSTLKIS